MAPFPRRAGRPAATPLLEQRASELTQPNRSTQRPPGTSRTCPCCSTRCCRSSGAGSSQSTSTRRSGLAATRAPSSANIRCGRRPAAPCARWSPRERPARRGGLCCAATRRTPTPAHNAAQELQTFIGIDQDPTAHSLAARASLVCDTALHCTFPFHLPSSTRHTHHAQPSQRRPSACAPPPRRPPPSTSSAPTSAATPRPSAPCPRRSSTPEWTARSSTSGCPPCR